jgi:hypothetical protein
VVHPVSQGPTGPFGIEIVAPTPYRPMNLPALKFHNGPPATPVERWIKSYLGRPAVLSTPSVNAPGVTYFYVSDLFDR